MTTYRGDRKKEFGIKDRIAVTLLGVFFRAYRFGLQTVTVTKPCVKLIWKVGVMHWSVFKLMTKIVGRGWKFEDMYENPGVLTVYFVKNED